MVHIIWTKSYGPYNMDHVIWTISYGPCHMDQIIWTISYGPYHMAIIIQSYDLCFTFNLQSTGTFKVFEAEFKNGQTRCRISKSKYSVSFLIIWFYIIWLHLIWSISYGTHTLNWPESFFKFKVINTRSWFGKIKSSTQNNS